MIEGLVTIDPSHSSRTRERHQTSSILRQINFPQPHQSKYYVFHREIGHCTDSFHKIKDEIKFLIKKGILNHYKKKIPRKVDKGEPKKAKPMTRNSQ